MRARRRRTFARRRPLEDVAVNVFHFRWCVSSTLQGSGSAAHTSGGACVGIRAPYRQERLRCSLSGGATAGERPPTQPPTSVFGCFCCFCFAASHAGGYRTVPTRTLTWTCSAEPGNALPSPLSPPPPPPSPSSPLPLPPPLPPPPPPPPTPPHLHPTPHTPPHPSSTHTHTWILTAPRTVGTGPPRFDCHLRQIH